MGALKLQEMFLGARNLSNFLIAHTGFRNFAAV